MEDELILALVFFGVGALMGAAMAGYLYRIRYREMIADGLERAIRDTLTGVYNRSFLATTEEVYDSVLVLDLDRFKQINDVAGHAVGDAVLVEVSSRIQSVIRGSDRLVRLGGDEFAILMQTCTNQPCSFIDSACNVPGAIAQKIQDVISKPLLIQSDHYQVSASIGFYCIEKGDSLDEAIIKADMAMYIAKQRLRENLSTSSIQVFSSSIASEMQQREQQEQELQDAIANGELELWYQPIVDLQSHTGKYLLAGFPVIGFEALVRWRHPIKGLISPAYFIPIAERAGLSYQIAKFVMMEAYWKVGIWSTTLKHPFKIGINLSTGDLSNPTIVKSISTLLKNNHIPPAFVTIEMTERWVGAISPAEVKAKAEFVKRLGASLSLDDFGTGQNTLIYLTLGIFDTLKIDREFVSGNDTTNDKALILCGLIGAIAHHKGIKVVAEGVETVGQARTLREHGIDMAQGYYFAKPMPPKDIESSILYDFKNS